MKANAPEKIYIHPDIGGREFLRPWLHRPANNESVEYVRKDAFIEKASEWVDMHFRETEVDDRWGESRYVVMSGHDVFKDDLLKDFKEYLKRE